MKKLKTENDVKTLIEDYDYEDVIIFSNPDYASAFIGMTEDGRAAYNYELMIEYLMDEYNWTDNEAVEFIDYNTLRAIPYMGAKAPVIVYPLRYIE